MYYIQTADRLTRTSKWLEAMEGGIDYLRDVIVNDRLQIADELERQAQFLVESYRCEWREVVKDPERRRMFRQFVNTDETEPGVEFVVERGQRHPAGWPSDFVPLQALNGSRSCLEEECEPRLPQARWHRVGRVSDFPKDAGACVKCEGMQIAVYRFLQPQRMARLPEHVPSQAGTGALARHPGRPGRRAEGGLSRA